MRVTDTQRLLMAIISLLIAGPVFNVWCSMRLDRRAFHGTDPAWRFLLGGIWLSLLFSSLWWVAEVRW